MANGDAEWTIRHSLLEGPPGRNPRAPATPSADRPRCPLSSEQGLENAQNDKGELLARVGIDLGSAHVRLGSAPPRLRRRYARNDGKRPWKWEQSEPVALASD